VSKRLGVALGVYGEPGIGKSWTVQQVLAGLVCRNVSVPATISDSGLAASLPRSKKLPAWAEKQLLKLEQGEFVDAGAVLNTLATTLLGLAPFVLHFEDVHEASPERFEMICKLAQVVTRSKGVGLIVTSRSRLPEPFGNLQPEVLSKAESDALLVTELGSNLPEAGLDYVFARAQGNPLFTLEFLRYLTRQGFLWSNGKTWHWRTPPAHFLPVSLEALLEQIMANLVLDPNVRDVLEARTLLAVPINVVQQVWLAVSGLEKPAFDAAKQTLEAGGILLNQDFTHPLIQEVVARRISESRRQLLAGRCFHSLEQSDPVMASHFIEQAGLENAQVLDLLKRADAVTIASEQKVKLLALRVQWTPLDQRFEVALEAARKLIDLDLTTAVQLAEFAIRLEPKNLEALYVMIEIRFCERRLLEANTLLESLPRSEGESIQYWQFKIRLYKESADLHQALELWHQRPELHEAADPITIQCLAWCVMETALPNEINNIESLISKTLSRDLSLQDRYLLLDARGNLAQRQDRYASAASDFALALEYASLAGSHSWRAKLCNDLAHVLYVQDQNQAAVGYLELAYSILLEHGNPFDLAHIQARLGMVSLELAQFEQAESLMQKSRETLQLSPSVELCEVNSGLASLYLSWNTAHSAVLSRWYASTGLKAARALGMPYALCLALFRAVQTEIKYGEVQTSQLLLTEFSQVLLEAPLPGLQARLEWAYGWFYEAQNQTAGALEHYRAATALFDSLNDQSLTRQAQLEVDRLNGDKAGAMAHLAWFKSQGLERLAQLVQGYFPDSDAIIPPKTIVISADSLHLKVLGTVSLVQHGQTINYRGRKRLEFLAYLLETRISGRAEAPTLEIIDNLYPELLEPEAKSALKQLVYLLRNKLGSEVIQSTHQGYALGTITSDAEQFLETGDASLWRGVYLESLADGWVPGVRDALIQALQQKIESLAKTDAKQTARIGQILLEMEPYDRDTLELILRALGEADPLRGNIYRQAQRRFEQIGETLPASSEAFLRAREISISAD
jgi:tetratricopeptide (TPR) repeat protein